MKRLNATNVIRAAILTSLATLMIAGFLVMGGLGSSDSAEARCSTRWFDRCQTSTNTTADATNGTATATSTTSGPLPTRSATTTAAPPTTSLPTTTTSTSTGGFLNCAKRWFDRCYDFTADIASPQ